MPDRHSFGEIHLDVTAGRERVEANLSREPLSALPFWEISPAVGTATSLKSVRR